METTPDIIHTVNLAQHLVPGGILALHRADRILTLFSAEQGIPHMEAQAQFSQREWLMLVALINAFPHLVTYEWLLAQLTQISHEESATLLVQARVQGTMRSVLWPVRAIAKVLRPKLASFSFTLVSVTDRGYLLSPLRSEKSYSQEEETVGEKPP